MKPLMKFVQNSEDHLKFSWDREFGGFILLN